jgi:hypothetical protein
MQKKWMIIVNVIVLIIVTLSLGIMVFNFAYEPNQLESEEDCIDVNKVASFIYDSCYDAVTKTIFLEVHRSYDQYQLKGFEFSFFDFDDRVYDINDVPNTNDSRSYKIPAEKNPQNLNVRLNIRKDFSAPVCEEPRTLFVKYCPPGLQEEGVNVSISPLNGEDIEDFIEVAKSPSQDSDVFSLDLVDKERIWKSQCESKWDCAGWEPCEDGIRKRTCADKKDCFISTDMPSTAEYCEAGCQENWECEWSKCSSGFTTPTCKDLNKCGTKFTLPQKLECADGKGCIPDIGCDEWSECDVDYNFLDLVGGRIDEIQGSKSRVCRDKSGCIADREETRSCSVGVDIYTKRFTKCGAEFIGIYDRLDNDLIARIEEGTSDNPYLNIRLDGGDSIYCDYCFDGIQNGDEESVDCGGSCEDCSDKYRKVTFKKNTWWDDFTGWIKKMIT